MLAVTPRAVAQDSPEAVVSIKFDESNVADMLERNDGRATLSELLRSAASLEVRAEETTPLVLVVYMMRGENVLLRYASDRFEAAPGSSLRLSEVLRDGDPPFGRFAFLAANVLEAGERTPAQSAVDQPARYLVNGVIPYHPKGWKSMPAFYIVAVPIDARKSGGERGDQGWPISRDDPGKQASRWDIGWPVSPTASVGIGVAFVEATRR
jgi:hypothetical protein